MTITPIPPRKNLGAFFWAGETPAQKNRAFRYKSSDLLMQILWAFRYHPWRERQLRTSARNCHGQFRGS
jgi:hypothetical protein